MDEVRFNIDGQPKTWDKYLRQPAGALQSTINRHTGYTPNRFMLGKEENVSATLLCGPPPSLYKISRRIR